MTNALQLPDPSGFINRHIFAPRVKTQEAINVLMQGGHYGKSVCLLQSSFISSSFLATRSGGTLHCKCKQFFMYLLINSSTLIS